MINLAANLVKKFVKIVILSSRFPYPIEKGDKLRLYHQMKSLATNHEIFLFSLTDEKVAYSHLAHVKSFCTKVVILPLNKWKSRFKATCGLFNTLPFQVNYFYSNRIKKEIDQAIATISPDAIFTQLVRMSEYSRDLEYPKLLDYMDAFSLGAARRSQFERAIIRKFFSNEAKRLTSYELNIANDFNQMTIISKQDKHHLSNNKPVLKERITVVSNGLDTDFFQPIEQLKTIQILFVGNMGYHPNILAAKFLINKISPMLSNQSKIQIAGARPSAAVRALESEHIEVTGWVDDIRDAYNNAQIFVAPIFSGAGQQNKILEAMSMGLPCITTSVVNHSIGAIDGQQIMIANDKEAFASKIDQLLADPELQRALSVNGRKFVKKKFSWESENKKLEDIILNIVDS